MLVKSRSLGFRSVLIAAVGALPIPGISADAALSQERYPLRPVTIIVPFAPGGLADLAARPLAAGLQRELKQPFVVLNRAGAAGAIGIRSVAEASADGYTILVSLVSISTLPAVSEAQGKTPTFTRDQFAPIARLIADPVVVYVRQEARWKTFGEMIADAKKQPGDLIYTSSGAYGPTHLPMEMLQQATGTKMRHVPTTGGGPAMTMLLGGNVDVFFTVPALGAQHVEGGKLRVLATSGESRLSEFPTVPTLKELGVDFDYLVWAGLFAPKNVPQEIQDTLGEAVAKVVASDEFKGAITKAGSKVEYQSPAAFRAWWDHDAEALARVIKSIKVEAPN